MQTQNATITLLVVSLIVNVVLAVLMAAGPTDTQRAVDTALLETAEQSLRLQSEILADLESKDEARLNALKARLRAGIVLQGYKSYVRRAMPKRGAARPAR